MCTQSVGHLILGGVLKCSNTELNQGVKSCCLKFPPTVDKGVVSNTSIKASGVPLNVDDFMSLRRAKSIPGIIRSTDKISFMVQCAYKHLRCCYYSSVRVLTQDHL